MGLYWAQKNLIYFFKILALKVTSKTPLRDTGYLSNH